MFADSPGLHGVEHPIYDVWLVGCKGGSTVIHEAPQFDATATETGGADAARPERRTPIRRSDPAPPPKKKPKPKAPAVVEAPATAPAVGDSAPSTSAGPRRTAGAEAPDGARASRRARIS